MWFSIAVLCFIWALYERNEKNKWRDSFKSGSFDVSLLEGESIDDLLR
jgi:hypothetical protein